MQSINDTPAMRWVFNPEKLWNAIQDVEKTAPAVAKEIGYSKAFFYLLFNGKVKTPCKDFILKVSDALQIDWHTLYDHVPASSVRRPMPKGGKKAGSHG